MKSILIASAFLFCATPGVAKDARSASPQPLTATLTLPFATVLPGVPFDVEITLTNTSRQPVKVGTIAHLLVTLPDGTPIPVLDRRWNRLRPYESADDTFIELAPGESARRVVGWNSGSPPNWSSTEGFSAPGSYDIAVELEIGGHLDDEDLSNYVGRIRTSTARLQRVLPLGTDEAIWNRMQQISGGRWTDADFSATKAGHLLAREIIDLHPASSYYPYALLLYRYGRNGEELPKYLEAAERFAESPAHAYLLTEAAHTAYAVAVTAAREKNHVRFSEFSKLAEKYFRAALDTAQLSVQEPAQRGLRRALGEREKTLRRR